MEGGEKGVIFPFKFGRWLGAGWGWILDSFLEAMSGRCCRWGLDWLALQRKNLPGLGEVMCEYFTVIILTKRMRGEREERGE